MLNILLYETLIEDIVLAETKKSVNAIRKQFV